HIREVDAVVQVLRCFEDENVTHVEGRIDPVDDIEIINIELMLSDLEIINRRLSKVEKMIKGDKSYQKEFELLKLIKENIENGNSIRNISFSQEEKDILKELNLLSIKPTLYVCNILEDD